MALTPPNDDAFFREVDDDLRRDRLIGLYRRLGKLAIGAIVIALALLAFGLWWRGHRAAQAGADGEQLTAVLDDLGQGRDAISAPKLVALANSPRDGYRAGARLTQAAIAAVKGDRAGAAAIYRALATDATLPQPMRDLALVRGVALDFDSLPPQQVIARLRPLVSGAGPWFGSAGELTAMAQIKLNRPDLAGPLFESIARNRDVPLSLRSRAGGMATALGRDVPPIAPAAPKE